MSCSVIFNEDGVACCEYVEIQLEQSVISYVPGGRLIEEIVYFVYFAP